MNITKDEASLMRKLIISEVEKIDFNIGLKKKQDQEKLGLRLRILKSLVERLSKI